MSRHPLFQRASCRLGWVVLLGLAAGCASTPQRPVVVEAPAPKISSEHLADLSLQLIARMESEKKWYAALSWLDRYRQQYPASATSNLLRARALAATGATVDAENHFKRLLSGPLAAEGYQGLGLLAAKQDQRDRAIGYFIQASRQDPTNADILNDLGYAYLQNHQLESARPALFRAGELAPANSRIWSNIALYYLLRNETFQAQEVIGSHQLDWHTQQMIHDEASRLMGQRPARAGVAAPAPTENNAAPFPNQPLTQMFSADPAQSTNPSRTAP
ncbi:tetratricopeptide repeat protein [Acidithiobacillus sp. M4-SHS-6]|uniref:tetratricopeptide repeat protein n=1 Tax=Acidithiobacillus sp. M4-SHS-6 TaxID=3383024 RepID=UPI0039BE2624